MTTLWSGLSSGAIYVLVAIGYNLVYMASGTFNFAHANLVMLGVFLTYFGLVTIGWPVAIVLCFAGVVMAFVALVEERVAIRPVKSVEGQLVTTIGIATLIGGVAQVIWGTTALSVPFFATNAPFTFLGGRVVPVELVLVATALVLTLLIVVVTRWTRVGLACLATAEDSEAALLQGINIRRLSLLAFAVSGALAGLTGPIVGPQTFAFSSLATALGLKGFVAMAIGGFGNIPGCLVGGFTVGIVEAFGGRYLGGNYQDLLIFGLLLSVLLVRPHGLFGHSLERHV